MTAFSTHLDNHRRAEMPYSGCGSTTARELVERADKILLRASEEQLEWVASELEEFLAVACAADEIQAGDSLAIASEIGGGFTIELCKLRQLIRQACWLPDAAIAWEELLLPEECLGSCFAIMTLAIARHLDEATNSLDASGRRELAELATQAIEYAEQLDRVNQQGWSLVDR